MSLIDMATTAANPYLLWIRIAAIVLFLSVVVGTGLYVRHVFNDRAELQAKVGGLNADLATEKQKVITAMEQLRVWQDTVNKMNQAVKNIKVQSDVYVQGVENEKAPVVTDSSPVAFILPTMSSVSASGRYANISTGRTGTPPP